jgi:hypothetical protein
MAPTSLATSYKFHVVITNPSDTASVNFTIQTQDPGGLLYLIPPRKMNFSAPFNSSSAMVGSKKQERGVGVLTMTVCSADNETSVAIQWVLEVDQPPARTAVTVPPIASLWSEYYVVTHCITNNCVLGIVAVSPQDVTIVNVTLRLRHSLSEMLLATLRYNGQIYEDGDVIQETLLQQQAMQVD